jgi:hypothetical protein
VLPDKSTEGAGDVIPRASGVSDEPTSGDIGSISGRVTESLASSSSTSSSLLPREPSG